MRRTMRWLMGTAAILIAGAIVASATGVAAAQPEQVNEFVPIDELPPEDRLPAAPFLVAAYSIVWLLAFGYFWGLSRRLSGVEQDVQDLRRSSGGGDGSGERAG